IVRSGFSRNPKSLTLCGSSRSIKIATRSPAFGLNTVFNRRERLNGGNVSGTISFVLAIIDLEVRSRTGVSQRKYLSYVTEPVTDKPACLTNLERFVRQAGCGSRILRLRRKIPLLAFWREGFKRV